MSGHPPPRRSSPKTTRRLDLLLVVLFVTLADFIAQTVVSARLELGVSVELIGSLLQLTPGENTGGALGLFRGASTIFAGASIAVIALLLLAHERGARSSIESVAFGAIVGGAIGNLLDRLTRGAVLDYFDLGVGSLRFPLFNLADLAICTGLAILGLVLLRERRTRS